MTLSLKSFMALSLIVLFSASLTTCSGMKREIEDFIDSAARPKK